MFFTITYLISILLFFGLFTLDYNITFLKNVFFIMIFSLKTFDFIGKNGKQLIFDFIIIFFFYAAHLYYY